MDDSSITPLEDSGKNPGASAHINEDADTLSVRERGASTSKGGSSSQKESNKKYTATLTNAEFFKSVEKKRRIFLTLKPVDEGDSFREFSPMKIGKAFRRLGIKPQSVEKSGRCLSVEVEHLLYAQTLHKHSKYHDFLGIKFQSDFDDRLNNSKGVVKNWEFKNATVEEWKELPLPEGKIVDAVQIVSKRNGRNTKTPVWILTFDTTTPPQTIEVEYLRVDVEAFQRKPLRCFKCQRFGHPGKKCRAEKPTCATCGKKEKHNKDCKVAPRCSNCRKDGHGAASKECPIFKQEVLIQKFISENGGSYQQARKALFSGTAYSEAVKKNAGVVPTPAENEGDRPFASGKRRRLSIGGDRTGVSKSSKGPSPAVGDHSHPQCGPSPPPESPSPSQRDSSHTPPSGGPPPSEVSPPSLEDPSASQRGSSLPPPSEGPSTL